MYIELSKFTINQIIKTLIGMSLILLSLHFVTVASDIFYPTSWLATISKWFDLDSERNIPTLVIGGLLGLCSLVSIILHRKMKRFKNRIFFAVMAAFFAYLASDELFSVHERFAEPIRNLLSIGNNSFFYHAWVLPALLVAGIGTLYLLFVRGHFSVSNKEYRQIIYYLVIFIVAIVTLEIIGTKTYDNKVLYRLLTVPIEESIELGMSSLLLIKLYSVYLSPSFRKQVNLHRTRST